MSVANPSISLELWPLLSQYSDEERFSFYGEWTFVTYGSTPELGKPKPKEPAAPELVHRKEEADKESRAICRRVSTDNHRQIGRALAKNCARQSLHLLSHRSGTMSCI